MNLLPSCPRRRRLLVLSAVPFVLAACGSAGGAGWTYAPLGPTPPPAASPADSPGGQSPGAGESPATGGSPSPGQSPGGGEAVTFDVVTREENPLAFEPAELQAAPGATVEVVYLNDSTLPHNFHVFAGPDPTAESLAQTEIVTGPGAEETVTFTAPDQPGDYFFHCDVHPQNMIGTLTVGD